MSSFVSQKFSSLNARWFAESFSVASIYLYVGKSLAWANEDSPPTANDTTDDHNRIWDNMAGAVRVRQDQVSLGIKRNNWTSGKPYERWHHANTALDNFYVLAGAMDRDVYKCLDNNGRSFSSAKPNHRNLGATKERDGYVWKYMYTIPESHFKRFATSTIIPVFTNADVSKFGSHRSILHLPISATNVEGVGKEYRGTGFSNGTAGVSTVNATIFTTIFANTAAREIKVVADSGLAFHNGYYNNSAFLVTSGKARGTYRMINDSQNYGASDDDTTSNLVLSSVISNIANGDTFIIGPRVRIDDIYGYGFLGIGHTNSYGNVSSIDVSMIGKDYANSNSKVVVGGEYSDAGISLPDGSGAECELILAPAGGAHGSDALVELNAKYVIVSPETPNVKDHQTGVFAGYGNEIRQIGLIRNPIDRRSQQIAKLASYDQRTTVYFEHPTVIDFKVDDTLYNSRDKNVESASGVLYSVCGETGRQYVTMTNVRGRFYDGATLYNRRGDIKTISRVNILNHRYPIDSLTKKPDNSVVEGGLTKYTGDVLYHENISKITRRLDQKENFKFVFEF